MTERERLIFFLKNANAAYKKDMPCSIEEFTADFLLGGGVIVPPLKLGDEWFYIAYRCHFGGESEETIYPTIHDCECCDCCCDREKYVASSILYSRADSVGLIRSFEKGFAFRTREEAEAALKEREDE